LAKRHLTIWGLILGVILIVPESRAANQILEVRQKLYPQPEKFDPDRWCSISPTIFEYTPFSAGPRMCIGATFAMMEMKIVLAILLQRYRLQLVHRAKVDRFGAIVTKPKYGIPVVVHTQDRQFMHGVGGVRGNVREMVDLPA